MELILAGIEADVSDLPAEVRSGYQPDAELARHNLVKAIGIGVLPVSSSVVLDVESISAINRVGFSLVTFGEGRAIVSGPGLATSALYSGEDTLTFQGGDGGGFSVTEEFTGSNVIQVDLPLNNQLTTVAKVTF